MKLIQLAMIACVLLGASGERAFAESKKFNILFVVGNATSLADRRQILKDNFGQFLANLNSKGPVEFTIGMTTTDFFSQNGALVQSAAGISVITDKSTNPEKDFGGMVDAVQDTATSFWEQGLASAQQALQSDSAMFLQPGVPLILIVMSDDDDWSCRDQCFGVEPENNSNWVAYPVVKYVDYFRSLKAKQNIVVSTFPLVAVLDNDCAVEHRGSRYLEVQMGTGYGAKGSVCASKMPQDFANIGTVLSQH